jgi:hypothetical protein
MIVSIPGAAALLVAAAALAVLVPVLGVLGTMKWSTIFKGLAAIAAVMVTIGLASVIAAPGLLLLGVALIPLGLGLMLVAKAAQIFAKAVALMSSEGQKGFTVLLAAITAFIALLANPGHQFRQGLVSIVDQVVVLAPKLVTALGKILTTVIAFIIEQAPKLAVAIGALITAVLKVVGDNGPKDSGRRLQATTGSPHGSNPEYRVNHHQGRPKSLSSSWTLCRPRRLSWLPPGPRR